MKERKFFITTCALPGGGMEIGVDKEFELSFESDLMNRVKLEINGILVFELKDAVNGELLFQAVKEALVLHPVFKSKLVKRHSKCRLVANDKDPVIKEIPWLESFHYGTDEFNAYPWNISYSEKRIAFVAVHFLTDGMGQFSFMKTILRFYFEKLGVEIDSDFGLIAKEDITRTTEEAFGKTGIRKKNKNAFKEIKVKASDLTDDFYIEGEDCLLHYFVINKQDISNLGKDTDTSTFAVVAALICKAFAEAAGLTEGYIIPNVAVDLRDKFGSITDMGFTSSIGLQYDVKKLKDRDLSLSATALRSQLDICLDESNLHNRIALANIMNGPLKLFFMPIAKKAFADTLFAKKAGFVYSHMTRLKLPAVIEDHIQSIYWSGASVDPPLMLVHGTTFGDKVYLHFCDPSKGRSVTGAFEKHLMNENVSFEHITMPGHGEMLYSPKCWK